jgi:hypothetical protein
MVKAVNKPDILDPVDIQRFFDQCIITLKMTWQPVTPNNIDMHYLRSSFMDGH